MDPQQLLVSNLCEALKQLQRYLVLALIASLSLMLMQLSSISHVGGQVIQLPGLVTTVDVSTAKLILGVAHVTLGFLALAASENAKNIAGKISDQQVRDAALTYPCVVTDADPWVRVPACIAPALFFIVALVAWINNGPRREWDFYFLAGIFGVLPYVVLVVRAHYLSAAAVVR